MAKKKKRADKRLLALGTAAVVLAAVIGGYIFSNREPNPDFMADGVLRVCIDAGHGGDDAGASDASGERLEKDDTLRVALAVRKCLNDYWPDIEVVMTRDGDMYPSLEDRCDIANDSASDLFVSIHRNSAEGASGVEVWCESTKPAVSDRLAEDIMSGLADAGVSKNRGVKYGTASNPKGDYYVNANTEMPACLIELGFITSEEDNRLLDEKLDDYARAIADAVGGLLTEER